MVLYIGSSAVLLVLVKVKLGVLVSVSVIYVFELGDASETPVIVLSRDLVHELGDRGSVALPLANTSVLFVSALWLLVAYCICYFVFVL